MLSLTWTMIVISLVVMAGIAAVVVSVVILQRGELYYRIRPEARPRRWVLISMLCLFAIFGVWFPIWIVWPNALVSRVLLALFCITFLFVGLVFRWLSPIIDAFVEKRGWPLR